MSGEINAHESQQGGSSRSIRQRQSYLNVLYLVLAFPLALLYFTILAVGLMAGLGTVLLWVGVPVLWLIILVWWRLAAFERDLAIDLLGARIRPMEVQDGASRSGLKQLQVRLSNPVTWKSLIYFLIKVPVSFIAFISTLILITGNLFVSFLMLAALLCVLPFICLFSILIGKPISGRTLAKLLFFSLTGWGLANISLLVINIMAYLSGQLARAMLGMSDSGLRLAEAKVEMEKERAKAHQAEQSRRELIVNVSHELRTPVSNISGHAEALLMAIEADGVAEKIPEELHSYTQIIHREAGRLSQLLDDLLSLARSDAGELHLDIQVVDVGGVVREVEQSLAPLAYSNRQVALISEIEEHIPAALADRQRLTQVLLNLVRNAIAYTPAGGIVSIRLEQAGTEQLALSVVDTGIGIPPEDVDRIFDRFYRTDVSRTRSSGGFGLGLAIVRELIYAMSGSISVESKVNEGSCFRVLLKAATF